MTRSSVSLAFAAAIVVAVCAHPEPTRQQDVPLYKVKGAPIDDRVNDLVQRMNLDEKIGQLILPFGAHYPQDYVEYNKTGLGATYPLPSAPGQQWWQTRNDWQRWQVNNTRLGIPTSFIAETLHSGYSHGTMFPMPCLQGCTWNTKLVHDVAAAIATEAHASGVDRGFSPVLHFCTDPRFGRCEESFGEDPALVSKMGVAAVTGLSGPGGIGAASTYLPPGKIATEAKHYAGYAYGGRDNTPSEMSETTLFDVYLRPWKAYAQAGGRAIMAAHNDLNGFPCHGNHELLTVALREKFGFGEGLCASDAGDISHLQSYRIVPDATHAAAWAINAGMDQELQHNGAFTFLPQALQAGLTNMSVVDRAVGNVLRQKFASGLFDPDGPVLVDPVKQAASLDTPEHRALARQVAEEGITLLKNDAGSTATLPLSGLGSTIKHIAIIGPNADNENSLHGGYVQSGAPLVTILDAVVAESNRTGAFTVSQANGACLGATPGCTCEHFEPNQSPCHINSTEWIPPAVALAKQADLVVAVLGDSSTILAGDSKAHEETGTCGEHFDRDSLDIVGGQLPLLHAIVAANPNVVLVLVHGRTVTFGAGSGDGFNSLFAQVPSVVSTWRPGEEAGNALWSILNGTINPSGRTAHTWPRTVGQVHQYVPWYTIAGSRSSRDYYGDQQPATPLIPFGFGLSYSIFSFKNIKLVNTTVVASGTFAVSLDITSKGPAGKCVVQVYFSQKLASRVRYDKMLLGFGKFDVPADSDGTGVTVALNAQDFEMWSRPKQAYVVEAGDFDIFVGQHSADHFWHGTVTVK
eukprot:m.69158 g.69158  ORF g.69158 m.69158 type:complete len:805 (+) comp13959_c0_seq1:103-2517(+)